MEFKTYLEKSRQNLDLLIDLAPKIDQSIKLIEDCIKSQNTLFFCGNGGSAADSQHLAAEFMGRFLIDRRPLSAIALTVDTSALTAIGNDYGYDNIFSRQLEGLGQEGDILYAISTSGNSANVLKAIEVAKSKGIKTIALTGEVDSEMSKLCEITIAVPSNETNHIQEMHIIVGHYICGRVESSLFS